MFKEKYCMSRVRLGLFCLLLGLNLRIGMWSTLEFPGSFPILLLFQVEFCPRLTDPVNSALPEISDFVMDII